MQVTLTLFLLAAIVLSVIAAWGLRRLGAPASSVLGGLCAGLVLGPTLLGRFTPDFYEVELIGGRDERIAYEAAVRRHGSDRIARDRLGATNDQRIEAERCEREIEARLEHEWQCARLDRQKTFAVVSSVLIVLFFVSCASRRDSAPGSKPDWYSVISVGLWSAVLPGCALLAVLRVLDFGWSPSIIAAAAVSIGNAAFREEDLRTSDEAEEAGARLVRAGARIATMAAVIAAGAALLVKGQWNVPTVAAIVCCGVVISASVLHPLFAKRRDQRHATGPLNSLRIHDVIFVPAMSVLIAGRIELFEHFMFWPLVAAMILSGDGRWFGAFLGAMLCGARKSLRTMRLVLAAMGAGSAQLAMTLLGLAAFVLPESLALALLAGALVMEATTGARRRMAAEIEGIERDLHETEEGD